MGNGKRAFKFLFNKGYEFDAIDQAGNNYPEKWATMIPDATQTSRTHVQFHNAATSRGAVMATLLRLLFRRAV